jgi:hypothetical protein
MREHALVKSTIIMKDMPLLMIILQHPLEHLHSLRCDSRPTSRGNGTGWQRRSWEERIERRLVGHPSSDSEPAMLQLISFIHYQSWYHDAAQFESDMSWSVSRTLAHLKQGVAVTEIDPSP